jgi:integrase
MNLLSSKQRWAEHDCQPSRCSCICGQSSNVPANLDDDGNQLYPTRWNGKFIDAPFVDKELQRTPTFTADQVKLIAGTATGRLQMMCVLLAASGLRAGELLGLEVQHFDGSAIQVRQAIWGGKVQTPKTPSARRYVDLHPDVAALLTQYIGDRKAGFVFKTGRGKPLSQSNILKYMLHPLLETLGISKRGFHCFRRFRNTHLLQQHCPAGLQKFWLGHATGKDMSDVYDKSSLDTPYRRDVARSMGVGFELPPVLTSKRPKPEKLGAIGRQEVLTACNA